MESYDQPKELRILVLEDTPSDAELAEYELRKAGIRFTSKRVERRDELAHAVVEELRTLVAGVNLHVTIEPIPPATGDRSMMRLVFDNLLSNAIKFSRSKDPAMIKVGGAIKGDEAVYYVKDNGVGFDMQYVDKLFGVFQRLHGVNEFEGMVSAWPLSSASSGGRLGESGLRAD